MRPRYLAPLLNDSLLLYFMTGGSLAVVLDIDGTYDILELLALLN
jgi:hypothetical protein